MEENETANESDVLRRNEDSSLNEEHTHFGSLDQGRSRAGVTDPFLQLPSVRGSLDMIGQNEATLDHAENDVHQVKNFVQPVAVDLGSFSLVLVTVRSGVIHLHPYIYRGLEIKTKNSLRLEALSSSV